MYLDKRSDAIVQYLIYHSSADSRELMGHFDLSRNQLSYSINKINEWCEQNHFSEIKRLRSGHFQVPNELSSHICSDLERARQKKEEIYILSEEERSNLIYLMIFSKRDYLSLNHFMIDMGISKNTAMRSLNFLRKTLPEEIEITYSRNEGYGLGGKEWDLRKHVIRIIPEIQKMYNGENFLKKYIGISDFEVQKYQEILENAEALLNIRFTDDRLDNLPYILALMIQRIESGFFIQESFHINNSMLSDTEEYTAASKIFSNWHEIPDQEKLFVTLQLLTMNIFSGDLLTESLSKKLSEVVDECLLRFERKACLTLNNKQELKNRLLLHLKPAYYRIKYHLNLKINVEGLNFNEQQNALKGIVYEAFQPLQIFIGNQIPDEEFEFISIFVLSGLSKATQKTVQKRAIVVCKSGILISQTLHAFLQKIFPDFDFLPPCSLREFANYENQADIVFSTVPIANKDSVYLVKPIMEQSEVELLRMKVINDLSGLLNSRLLSVSVKNIMSLVEKYGEIKKPKQLEEALFQLIHGLNNEEMELASGSALKDVLKTSHIQIVKRVHNYREAIKLASQPLVTSEYISDSYVDKMIENHDFDNPYIVLGEEIAIPHALPEYGVRRLGVSVLYVREGVFFSKEEKLHFIFVLAPVDKEKHLEMLYEIMNLAENNSLLEKLKCAENEKILYEWIIQ